MNKMAINNEDVLEKMNLQGNKKLDDQNYLYLKENC